MSVPHQRPRWPSIITRVAAVLGLAVAALAINPAPANAYNFLGCKFSSGSVPWSDITGSSTYGPIAQAAANSWTNAGADVTYTKVSSGAKVAIRLYSNTSDGLDGTTWTSACQPNGVYSGSVTHWWNTYYTGSYSNAKRQSVMAHEMGHGLGLAHSGGTICGTLPLMYYHTGTRYDTCGIYTPRDDDKEGARVLY